GRIGVVGALHAGAAPGAKDEGALFRYADDIGAAVGIEISYSDRHAEAVELDRSGERGRRSRVGGGRVARGAGAVEEVSVLRQIGDGSGDDSGVAGAIDGTDGQRRPEFLLARGAKEHRRRAGDVAARHAGRAEAVKDVDLARVIGDAEIAVAVA